MGLYARYLLPRLTHLTMARKLLLPYRQRVIGGAAGRVLEIGIGSGVNLPLYSDAVEEVIGIDISPELLFMAERAAALSSQRRRLQVRLLQGPSTCPTIRSRKITLPSRSRHSSTPRACVKASLPTVGIRRPPI